MASRIASAAGVLAAGLALASPAAAATFCVPATGPSCSGTPEATIAAALTAAHGNNSPSPTKDTIRIAPGTYHGPFDDESDNPVRMIGAGPATLLDEPSTDAPTLFVGTSASEVDDVRVTRLTGSSQPAIFSDGALVRVTVPEAPGDAGATGVSLVGAGSLDQSTVSLTDAASVGVAIDTGVVTRSRITAAATAVRGTTHAYLYDDLVRVTGTNGTAIDRPNGTQMGGFVTARQDTLIGPSSGGSVGVHVGADTTVGGFGGGASQATLDGLVIRGFGTDLSADGGTSQCGTFPNQVPCDEPATISIDHSDFATAREHTGTAATITPGSGNFDDVDPSFRDAGAGDFSLARGSPLVDAGDPQGPQGAEPTLDLAGAKRVLDGDGDGQAIVDIGAFELRPPPPPIASFVAPRFAVVGRSVRFDGSPSRDTNGAALSFHWRFGDGTSATGKRPAHVYDAKGTYTVRLVVRNSLGRASKPATRRLPVFAKPPCVVPKLRGKTLDAARTALGHAHCGVGAVTHQPSKQIAKGRVIASKPPAGAVRTQGTKVALVASSG